MVRGQIKTLALPLVNAYFRRDKLTAVQSVSTRETISISISVKTVARWNSSTRCERIISHDFIDIYSDIWMRILLVLDIIAYVTSYRILCEKRREKI